MLLYKSRSAFLKIHDMQVNVERSFFLEVKANHICQMYRVKLKVSVIKSCLKDVAIIEDTISGYDKHEHKLQTV